MPEADLLSDERLVGLTLAGDRDAFGQIVARYQSPICALAYSACGSISRSEDLAQEVFVAAWRRLRDLKDHAKLKSWLYAIARNLISSAFRQQSRNPLGSAELLDEAVESGVEACGPCESAISKEEEAILWQVLSGLPEAYRQPMVLFYRQEESMAGVAEILGISEEAVRQRLSRGRAMLNERVAKVVEIGLRRSGPSKAFGLAVLAALPAVTVKAGTIGAATGAAQGSGALIGTGPLSVIGSIASTGASVLGGLVGMWGRVQNARSARERAFARRTVWGLLAFSAGFLVAYQLLFSAHLLRISNQPADALIWTLLWIGFMGPLCGFTIWRGRQQRRIQIEEGATEATPAWQMWTLDPARPGFRGATYGTLACLVFGTCGWLLVRAIEAQDQVLTMLLAVLCVSGWLLGGAAIIRRPARTRSIVSAVWWSLALLNLVVVNLRWAVWFGGQHAGQLAQPAAPWTVDYLILLFFASAQVAWWLRHRFMALPDARGAARLAIGVYLALMLSGVALLAVLE